MAVPSDVTTEEFFRAIWGDTEGWAELTAISKARANAFPFHVPESISSIYPAALNHSRTANVYMGVCLRREKWPRPSGKTDSKGKPLFEQRGTEANAQSSWCVWCEIDFEGEGHKGRVTPEDVVRKKLKEFKFSPSIIVRSGGGIHVYWLLKEAAEGDDLWRVKSINKALAVHFDADTQSVDLARILRIPGTENTKYSPPRKVSISWWKPEKKYTLYDFEDTLPTQKIYPVYGHQGPKGLTEGAAPDRKTPSIDLPEDSIAELSTALSDIWIHGYKHECALHVAGMFAWAGILEETAKAVIRIASDATQGSTEGRLKDVESTYQNFLSGRPVTGRTTFEKMFKADSYPEKQGAVHFLDVFQKITGGKNRKKDPDPDPDPAPHPPETQGPEIHTEVDKLPISDYGRRIIKEGHSTYVDFLKNTETPARFMTLQAEGKMTRAEADGYIITLLLQAGIEPPVIHSIFKDPKYKIGEKSREAEERADEYVAYVIKECKHAIKAQPKWQATSTARAAAAKVNKTFEDEHFRVKTVVKYLQDNPNYDITIVLEGIEYMVHQCSLDQVWTYEAFSKKFFSKFNRRLPKQSDATWDRMYSAGEYFEVQVEKEEGTFEGQMDVIISLLEETAVDSKSADISINHSAVRTKDGQVVFKTPLVLRMLKDRWIDAKKQDVTRYLKQHHWDYKSKRLGKRVDFVWSREAQEDKGTQPINGSIHTPPTDHKDSFESKTLFPEESNREMPSIVV